MWECSKMMMQTRYTFEVSLIYINSNIIQSTEMDSVEGKCSSSQECLDLDFLVVEQKPETER